MSFHSSVAKVLWLSLAILIGGLSTVASALPFQSEFNATRTRVFPVTGEFKGQVVDEEGTPVAFAKVVQFSKHSRSGFENINLPNREVFAETTTDLGGQFQFPPLDYLNMGHIAAVHPDFQTVVSSPMSIALTGRIVLTKGRVVEGRVVHFDGEGVGDVLVSSAWNAWRDVELRNGLYSFPPEMPQSILDSQTVQTDSDGRFRFPFALNDETLLRFQIPEVYDETYGFQPDGKWRFDPILVTEPYSTFESIVARSEVTLNRPQKLVVDVFDENNQPVQIVRFYNTWDAAVGDSFWPNDRGDIIRLKGNSATIEYFRKGFNRFYAFPNPDTDLLPLKLELLVRGEVPERLKMTLKQGCVVTGVVQDSVSRQPLENVAIRYFPANWDQFSKLNVAVPEIVRTDAQGQYRIVVPEMPGYLFAVGEVFGYETISTNSTIKYSDELNDKFKRQIEPELGEALQIEPFLLNRARILKGKVLSPDGQPLSGVNFLATHRFYEEPSTMLVGQTDVDGTFEIVGIFDNALKNYIVQANGSKRTDAPNENVGRKFSSQMFRLQRDSDLGKDGQELIFFWHEDRAMNALVEVSIDQMSEPLNVELQHAPAVVGRVIDKLNGEPVAGVTVSFSAPLKHPNYRNETFKASAVTRDDGTFLIEHFNFNPESKFQLAKSGYWPEEVTAPAELKDETNYFELKDDLVLERIPVYGDPKPLSDISEMPDRVALETLLAHIAEELERVPYLKNTDRRLAGPVKRFLQKLVEAVSPQILELSARHPDSDYQLSVYYQCLEAFGDRAFHSSFADWLNRARVLMAKNLDRPEVFELFRKTDWTNGGSDKDIIVILDNCRSVHARQWAIEKEAKDMRRLFDLLYCCNDSYGFAKINDNGFETRMAQAALVWKIALSEFQDSDPNSTDPSLSERFGQSLLEYRKSYFDNQDLDQERARRVRGLINSLVLID